MPLPSNEICGKASLCLAMIMACEDIKKHIPDDDDGIEEQIKQRHRKETHKMSNNELPSNTDRLEICCITIIVALIVMIVLLVRMSIFLECLKIKIIGW